MDSDEDDFGPTAPPLSVFIQGILRRYPDGSQILKELLQNAEDAGATEIKFLHDKKTYGTVTLFQENLACCQGPALCAYNDAQFQECDWKGIQRPQQSHKAASVLKVGKFGIGFNSVYHLTDMPWLLSGPKLAVMEPTEKLFNSELRGVVKHRSGFDWKLDRSKHRHEIEINRDQFQPIEEVAHALNPSFTKFAGNQKYEGTLFRLPLRVSQTTFSDNIYTNEMIEELFNSFSDDAANCLLFLRRIERVKLITRNPEMTQLINCEAKIVDDDLQSVRTQRKHLIHEIERIADLQQAKEPLLENMEINMTFTIQESKTQSSQTNSWIVAHHVPKQSAAPRAWELSGEVNRLPWVSLAAKIEHSLQGRIFCFLPLPDNEEIRTGLPVHVNAYFGLEDNRRNLKWLAADQNRDIDAQWNDTLLNDVIPNAYVQLIRFCKELYGEVSYDLWPSISNVHERWKPILPPLLKQLFQLPLLKVSSPNGQWTNLHENLLIDTLDETFDSDVAAAVGRWLDKASSLYIRTTKNIVEAIRFHSQQLALPITYVSPSVVKRELAAGNITWDNQDSEDRLLLLKYFVTATEDCSTAASFITDFPIIPLANGNFGSLNTPNHQELYLADETFKELLLPLTDRIIEIKNLPQPVVQFLRTVTRLNYNIKYVDATKFPAILREYLPQSWKNEKNLNCNMNENSRINKLWLQNLWGKLRNAYPASLNEFVGLTLLEYRIDGSCSDLVALPSEERSVLFVNQSFQPNIEKLLAAANAISVPCKLLEQHELLKRHVHTGGVQSLIQLLENCGSNRISTAIREDLSAGKELGDYIASHVDSLPNTAKTVLKQLPLFNVLHWPKNLPYLAPVSIDWCCSNWARVLTVSFDGLPSQVQTEIPLLDCRSNDYHAFSQWLGVPSVSQSDLANEIITKKCNYNQSDFSALMLWCLNYVQAWIVKGSLQNYPFIPSDGNFYSPTQMFDPTVSELKNFFEDEQGRFPTGVQYTSPAVLEFLRGLGLRRTVNDITADEILQTARAIGLNSSNKRRWFLTILTSCFLKLPSNHLIELQSLKLFQAKLQHPQDYPNCLPWYGSDKEEVLYSAAELLQEECWNVAGSVMPVLGSTLPQELVTRLRLATSNEVRTAILVQQLKVVADNYSAMRASSPTLQSMLYKIYEGLSKRPCHEVQQSLDNQNFKQWIWVDEKFVAPTQVVTKWVFFKKGLIPYMYSLPSFCQSSTIEQFFKQVGVSEDNGSVLGKDILQQIVRKYLDCAAEHSDDAETDLNYVKDILEVIAADDTLNEDILIPIQHKNTGLKFLPASQCKYNDSGSCGNFLDGYLDDEDEDIILAHNELRIDLCMKLGATPWSNAVLGAEEFEQQETILQRLKNILEEYPPGATIIQELVQNADDAGATRVGILVDMRSNNEWRQSVLWKSAGMDEFQGPALWVYNDAFFTESDFKNILQVGGATKRTKSDKIGSFGVGFNSVYNITDMPSFVSGQYFVIFDPHKRCIPRTGGIKFDLKKKPKLLQTVPHQFEPFRDIFSCNLSYSREGATFNGTLFRLPLRDENMAYTSELSKVTYDSFRMKDLLQKYAETSGYAILFVQNVKNIDVQYLPFNCPNPLNVQKVLSIRKQCSLSISSNTPSNETFVQTVKNALGNDSFVGLHESSIITMTNTSYSSADEFSIAKESTIAPSWVVQWTASTGEAYQLARKQEAQASGLMPAVAIAAKVSTVDKRWKPEVTKGLAFCYLPLPVETGLPFHIHAAFALASNRCHLWTENVRDLTSLKTMWNEALKKNALVMCFLQLLETLKLMDGNHQLENYEFCSLWPVHGVVVQEFAPFLQGVYEHLCLHGRELWKTDDGRWVTFAQARFLLLPSQWSTDFCNKIREAFQISIRLLLPDCGLVSLSSEVQSTLKAYFPQQFETCSCTEKKFLQEIFFPNLHHYDSKLTNDIILYLLTENRAATPYLKEILQNTNCIPVTPDGSRRARPRDLIDPKTEIHKLFEKEEGRFPFGPFEESRVRDKLVSLGMLTYPTGGILVERAQSVENLMSDDVEKAKSRSYLICQHLVKSNINDSWYAKFQSIYFMFSMPKPEDWSLHWYKPNDGRILYAPKELFARKQKHEVCFVAPIWDERCIKSQGLTLCYHLLNGNSDPPVEVILNQLEELSTILTDGFTQTQLGEAQKVVTACLKPLQKHIKVQHNSSLNRLKEMDILVFPSAGLVPFHFVCSKAMRENYSPYLFSLKETPYEKFQNLLEMCGVKRQFSTEDYLDALRRLKLKFEEEPLGSSELSIAKHLCSSLADCFARMSKDEVITAYGNELPVPDHEGILRPASKLVFWELDTSEIPQEFMDGTLFCRRDIPRHVALKLGVSLLRTKLLDKFREPFEFGESFGQHEELTTRIKNILDEYSNRSDVLNEMIQNADDAGASEIGFILDERQLPTDPKKLLSDNWRDLQGPALIVYNTKPFEENDFEGIRNLGLGSKRANPELTGKFGIGFNTVYHLTDVPMFISNGEVLIVLDPHMKYVPTAEISRPGGRFKVTEKFKTVFPNVTCGFLPVDDLPTKDATIFRLPLRKKEQFVPSKIGKPISSKEVFKILEEFSHVAEDLFFFLKNIRTIRITCVNNEGKTTENRVFSSHMSNEDELKKAEFFQMVTKPVDTSEDKTVIYKTRVCNNSSDKGFEWLILQCLSCMKKDVPPDLMQMRSDCELTASPLVGIAIPLQPVENKKFRTYTTLPLSGFNKLPFHINGKFMLDKGRKQCYLQDGTSYKTQWNQYLITNVLAPLYVQALEYLKKTLDNDWKTSTGFDHQESLAQQYQVYLPTMPNSEKLEYTLMNQVYELLYRHEYQLLFGITLSWSHNMHFKRNLYWLSITDGIIDDMYDEEKRMQKMQMANMSYQQMPDCQEATKIECIRKVLETVHFPKFHCGFNDVVDEIRSILKPDNCDPSKISPLNVASHMKRVNDELLLVPNGIATTLPVDLRNVVLSSRELASCLSYILEENNCDLNNIPLSMTADGKLRRFNENEELYANKFTELLPSQRALFCTNDLKRKSLPTRFLKEFSVHTIAKHLRVELPHLYQQKKVEIENVKPLIYKILRFLTSSCNVAEEQLRQTVATLNNWALLPVVVMNADKTISKYLISLDQFPFTVFAFNCAESEKDFYSILRNLGCKFAEVDILLAKQEEMVIKFFATLCATHSASERILRLLYDIAKNETEDDANFNRLSKTEKSKLFYYLANRFYNPLENLVLKSMIKALPIFKTLEDNFTSLITPFHFSLKTHFYVACSGDAEGAELDTLMSKNITLLSKDLAGYKQFCEWLGVNVVDKYEIYTDYIIPYMHEFSTDAVVRHLDWIKTDGLDRNQKLKEALGRVNIIPLPSGNKIAINKLYDSSIEKIFCKLLPESNFISQTFWDVVYKLHTHPYGQEFLINEWETFLKNVGLKDKLTEEAFIQLAQQLEANEKSLDVETVKERSNILVTYFKSRFPWDWKENFTATVSRIKFIYAASIPNNLNTLYNQEEHFIKLICYNSNVMERDAELCWTVCELLPSWSTDGISPLNLGFQTNPPINTVMRHTEKLCRHLQPLKANETTEGGINGHVPISTLQEVMEKILTFLRDNISNISDAMLTVAKTIPLVLVENGRYLVCANQVIFADKVIECPPFLYILPEELYRQINLLKALGTARSVTYAHYSMVMKMLRERVGEVKVEDPNLKSSLQKAYVEFINQIREVGPENVSDKILYLPDDHSCLRKSTEIFVFPPFTNTDSIQLPGYKWNMDMLKLKDCKTPMKTCCNALIRLPEVIRPTSLSEFEMKQVSKNCKKCTEPFCEHSHNIERLFVNPLFVRILTKLINLNELHEARCPAEQDKMAAFFSAVKVTCYEKITIERIERTNKKLLGEEISQMFWNRTPSNTIEILVTHEQKNVMIPFVQTVVHLLKFVCPLKSKPTERHLASILSKLNLEKQNESLVEISIESLEEDCSEEAYVCRLGTVVPESLTPFLDQNAQTYFKPFEFIACAANSNVNEDDLESIIYIYGQIIKEVEPTETDTILKYYQIDIGTNYPVVKSALEIYKFIPPREIQKEMQLTAGSEQPLPVQFYLSDDNDEYSKKFSRSLEETLIEVTKELESIFTLSLGNRQKAIRRLYLYWHPDKNPTKYKCFCEEVFKHILNEISRLERGQSTGSKSKCDWGKNFHSWNNYARRDREQTHNYYNSAWRHQEYFRSFSRSTGIPPSFARNSNVEAKLWCQAAKNDLESALSEMKGANPCYEWVFYKFYQVARKCMVSMLFTKLPYEVKSTSLKALSLDVMEAFSGDPGDIHDLIQIMVKKGVDDSLPLQPSFGKTPRQHYMQHGENCQQVYDLATKLVDLAKSFLQ